MRYMLMLRSIGEGIKNPVMETFRESPASADGNFLMERKVFLGDFLHILIPLPIPLFDGRPVAENLMGKKVNGEFP